MQTREIDLSTPKKSNCYLTAMADLEAIQARKQKGAVTLSGDAWEAAAHHVIALREKAASNRDTWRQIGEFLDAMPKAAS